MAEGLKSFFQKAKEAVQGPPPRERMGTAEYKKLIEQLHSATNVVEITGNVPWDHIHYDGITIDRAEKALADHPDHPSAEHLREVLQQVEDTRRDRNITDEPPPRLHGIIDIG